MAIIDLGFKGARHLPGDMPARWWSHDFTDEGIYTDDESVHGTACAEIVHDVAPEAELYLYKVGDLLDLENAKDLCINNGVDIISHSALWLGTGIGDGKGIACKIVDDAADKGILWVNAAGNSAKSHYYQPWSDSDSDGVHNFKDSDEVLSFEAEEGTEISIYLTWNDWPETRDDYDLYLYFSNSSGDLERVAESTNVQSGSGGYPVESIEYKADRSGKYGVVVSKSQDARSRRLKIWSLNRNLDFEYSGAERSIGIPADAEGAMSVGAIYYDHYNLGRIADYSSRGPTLDGRIKPELVAPTGVSTVSYSDRNGYHGTSAAAPHVAGAAALIKSANPSYSRTQLWNALIAATVDIGTRGRDNDSGYGKLVLPIMQVSASPSPQITSVSPSRAQYNQVVTIRGTAFGANRSTSRVIFQGGKEPSSSQYVSWSDTRIQVRVPAGARTGNVQVITANGSDTARLTITSPWISSISPQTGRTNTVVTISGGNFGSSRGSSSVRIGSVAIPSSSFISWSSSAIRFRIPLNTPPGNLTVRTSEGTSNAIRLAITSPYLTSISPTRVKTGDRLTLTGGNFGTRRGSGYVSFFSNVRASAADYVSWSNSRIVVKVPVRAQSGNVQVVSANGRSGTKRLEIESGSPQITSVSPSRAQYNQVVTIRGTAFGANRGTSRVIFREGKIPSSSQYISWSDTQIRVRVPTGARTGDVQVVTAKGSDSYGLTITSPWISSISPQTGRTNTVVTINGGNFGSSVTSSTVRIGSVVVSSTSFTSWSSSRIRFRIPLNTPPGNLTVSTSEGTSNAIHLAITSPYLTSISPTQVKTGGRLTLIGGNFGTRRGTGYVLFTSNVRPSAADYVSWSNSRIVVEVPARAQSGDVQIVSANGRSGTKRLEIGSEQLESLPSRGLFGYSPPAVTKNPQSVKFGFGATNTDIACYFSVREISDGEVTILLNERSYSSIPESEDWTSWYLVLDRSYLRSGTNIIEFRNIFNQNRTSSFAHWQLKDVWVGEPPPSAKPVAGMQLLSKLPDGLVSGLSDPFPTPFNAEVTIPFVLAEAGPVRLVVYNLMGQQIRVLADGWEDAGAHRVRWDGRTAAGVEAASGVYWAVLHTGDAVQTAKLALIR